MNFFLIFKLFLITQLLLVNLVSATELQPFPAKRNRIGERFSLIKKEKKCEENEAKKTILHSQYDDEDKHKKKMDFHKDDLKETSLTISTENIPENNSIQFPIQDFFIDFSDCSAIEITEILKAFIEISNKDILTYNFFILEERVFVKIFSYKNLVPELLGSFIYMIQTPFNLDSFMSEKMDFFEIESNISSDKNSFLLTYSRLHTQHLEECSQSTSIETK